MFEEKLKKYQKEYEKDSANKFKQRMLNKVQIVDLVQDKETKLSYDFNLTVKTHESTNQEASGRCWIFAGLNILREKVISKCALNNFELSGSFVAFYDKLERFNLVLEQLIQYKEEKKTDYDRDVSYLLEKGITDGGYFTDFACLIEKYGIVPKSVFPETFSSSNTYEINQILSRLVRMFYLELDKQAEEETHLQDEYLEKAYQVMATAYGIPPEIFDFEYTDKKGEYHSEKNLTPKEFYDTYIGMDLSEYVEITSNQDEKMNYHHVYEEEDGRYMSGSENRLLLNVPAKEFKKLIIKQLKALEPVCFYCSTTAKRIDGVWVDLIKRYGELFNLDLTLDKNDFLKTNGITACHCMLITGVNLVDQKPTKWKIENSWGKKVGNQGYYVATDDWLDKYVHRIVIHKKYLSKMEQGLLTTEKILIKKWDIKM